MTEPCKWIMDDGNERVMLVATEEYVCSALRLGTKNGRVLIDVAAGNAGYYVQSIMNSKKCREGRQCIALGPVDLRRLAADLTARADAIEAADQ